MTDPLLLSLARRQLASVVFVRDYLQLEFDVPRLPLGRLYGLDDEWEGGWGRTPAELTAEVEARCAEQLRAAAP